MRIENPGVYSDLSAELYHADPCPTPSLSAGGVHTLVTECPRMLWWRHPRLNPGYAPADSSVFDIGKAAHLIVLEPHKLEDAIQVIEASDYRSTEARKARDAARTRGKIPLLSSQLSQIQAMHAVLYESWLVSSLLHGGRAEVSAFWKDEKTEAWCRIRPDYIGDSGRDIIDYKTAISANPEAFARSAYAFGYHSRAAFYLEGWRKASGFDPENYWFIVQQKTPPYLVSVIKLEQDSIDAGRAEFRYALDKFSNCLQYRYWPGYRMKDYQKPFTVSLPAWAHLSSEERLARLGGYE